VIHDAIMESAGAALPEFELVRDETVATPVGRQRNVRVLVLGSEREDTRLEFGPIRERRTLV
jgi:hypothetical protein